jgi:hypothetical protein
MHTLHHLQQTTGNIVSELGIGPWRQANENFLATFTTSFQLYEQRIGAPSSVDIATGACTATGVSALFTSGTAAAHSNLPRYTA